MQALFSAFASNKRTHRQWKCIGIGIGIFRAQKYRRYLIDKFSEVAAITPSILKKYIGDKVSTILDTSILTSLILTDAGSLLNAGVSRSVF